MKHWKSRWILLFVIGCAAVSNAAIEVPPPSALKQDDTFELVYGNGVDVCGAYVQALNEAKFPEPPYCDRPQLAPELGFRSIQRQPLTEGEIRKLLLPVSGLLSNNDATCYERIKPVTGSDRWLATLLRDQSDRMRDGKAPAYFRVLPDEDLNADGVKERLVVWAS